MILTSSFLIKQKIKKAGVSPYFLKYVTISINAKNTENIQHHRNCEIMLSALHS